MDLITDPYWRVARFWLACLFTLLLVLYGSLIFYRNISPGPSERVVNVREIFKNNKTLFQTVAEEVRSEKLNKSIEVQSGLEFFSALHELKISTIFLQGKIVFFECQHDATSGGLAYCPEDVSILHQSTPPTKRHFRNIHALGHGWFEYSSE
jgi:hypothetical protein